MALHGPQEPKPYDFVPLPDRVERATPAGHGRFKRNLLNGVIRGELLALSPVHVASGNIELTGASDTPLFKAHFRSAGRLTIPGSSLKGAVRSIFEAVTRSCVRVQSRTTRERLPQGFAPCDSKDQDAKLCPACRVFGAMGYQGQARFADAGLSEGGAATIFTPSLFSPRTFSNVYYQHRGQVKGRKFYFHGELAKGNVPLEVCSLGSVFELKIGFANLSEAELGVLLIALGQGSPPFNMKLGGAKPACCGSIEIKIKSIDVEDIFGAAAEYDVNSSAADSRSYISAAENLIVRPNLEKLNKILRDDERHCPSGVY